MSLAKKLEVFSEYDLEVLLLLTNSLFVTLGVSTGSESPLRDLTLRWLSGDDRRPLGAKSGELLLEGGVSCTPGSGDDDSSWDGGLVANSDGEPWGVRYLISWGEPCGVLRYAGGIVVVVVWGNPRGVVTSGDER